MEFVVTVWAKRFSGCQPPPGSATILEPVYQALGDEEATDRLRTYLQDTPAKYVNLHRFAATHSDYAKASYYNRPPDRKRGELAPIKEILRVVSPSPPTEATVEVEVDQATGRLRPKSS